jgi:hypothetical protein
LSGRAPMAEKILRSLDDLSKQRYVSPFEFALLHLALGHTDLGFKFFAKAADDRAFELLALKVDPRFMTIRGDRRFGTIIRRVGLEAA